MISRLGQASTFPRILCMRVVGAAIDGVVDGKCEP